MNKKKANRLKIPQFPKIYRFITEELKFARKKIKIIVFGFVFGIILALLLILAVDLIANFNNKKSLESQRKHLQSQVVYWQNFVNNQKGYRDGYFMLAVLEYQLKDFVKAGEYNQKVLSIDPSFSPAIDLQKVLNREVK